MSNQVQVVEVDCEDQAITAMPTECVWGHDCYRQWPRPKIRPLRGQYRCERCDGCFGAVGQGNA